MTLFYVTDDVDLLTPTGWKPIHQHKDESVAGSDDGHDFSFYSLENLTNSKTPKNIIHCESASCDFLAPAEINMLYSYSSCKRTYFSSGTMDHLSKKVGQRKLYTVPVNGASFGIEDDFVSSRDLGFDFDRKLNSESLLSILGWVISEGYMRYASSGSPRGFTITQIKRESYKDDIRKNLQEIDPSFSSHYDHRGETEWSSYDRQLVSMFSEVGRGSVNKRIPRWAFLFGKKKLNVLLRSLMLGDGSNFEMSLTGNNSETYYTVSPGLVDDLQELCLYLGIRTNPYKREKRSEARYVKKFDSIFVDKYDQYQIGLSRKSVTVGHLSDSFKSISGVGKWYSFSLSEKCVYIRRNGKICLLGGMNEVEF